MAFQHVCAPPAQSPQLPTLGRVGVAPGQALPRLPAVVSGLLHAWWVRASQAPALLWLGMVLPI